MTGHQHQALHLTWNAATRVLHAALLIWLAWSVIHLQHRVHSIEKHATREHTLVWTEFAALETCDSLQPRLSQTCMALHETPTP